jgi:hypothetical protein
MHGAHRVDKTQYTGGGTQPSWTSSSYDVQTITPTGHRDASALDQASPSHDTAPPHETLQRLERTSRGEC